MTFECRCSVHHSPSCVSVYLSVCVSLSVCMSVCLYLCMCVSLCLYLVFLKAAGCSRRRRSSPLSAWTRPCTSWHQTQECSCEFLIVLTLSRPVFCQCGALAPAVLWPPHHTPRSLLSSSVPSLPCPPITSLPLPSPPSLPLEVGPLNPARGSGGAL